MLEVGEGGIPEVNVINSSLVISVLLNSLGLYIFCCYAQGMRRWGGGGGGGVV